MGLDGIGGSPTGKQRPLDAWQAAMLPADEDPRPDAVDLADGAGGGRRLVRQGMGNAIGLKMPPAVDLRAEPIGQLILDALHKQGIVLVRAAENDHGGQGFAGRRIGG